MEGKEDENAKPTADALNKLEEYMKEMDKKKE